MVCGVWENKQHIVFIIIIITTIALSPSHTPLKIPCSPPITSSFTSLTLSLPLSPPSHTLSPPFHRDKVGHHGLLPTLRRVGVAPTAATPTRRIPHNTKEVGVEEEVGVRHLEGEDEEGEVEAVEVEVVVGEGEEEEVVVVLVVEAVVGVGEEEEVVVVLVVEAVVGVGEEEEEGVGVGGYMRVAATGGMGMRRGTNARCPLIHLTSVSQRVK